MLGLLLKQRRAQRDSNLETYIDSTLFFRFNGLVLKPFIKHKPIMNMESEGRTFSCLKCGQPFVAQSPYEGYELALAKPCRIKDHDAPQLYECENCKQRNVLYWCPGKRS
jgi:hypothetical protein